MADISCSTIRIQKMILDIRSSVAFRERRVGKGVVFYLSLVDDEIDDRVGRFLDPELSVSDKTSVVSLK